SYLNGRVSLLSAALVASPDAAVDVDGPRWILRTIWRAEQPLPDSTRIDFWLDRRDGQRQHVWDVADLWWNPPEQWAPGTPVTVDIPDAPIEPIEPVRRPGWLPVAVLACLASGVALLLQNVLRDTWQIRTLPERV